MIGKPLPLGKGFLGLVRYLARGHAGEERDRVAWVESRNLPTEDPETAARLMAAWARESVRTQRPVYHLVISADPGDPADRASLSRVADSVLRELGLSEHQVLIIAHNDTAHPHMHLVVNRVHPETHKAWLNSWDWPKIEKALTAEEVALGWRVVPKPHARVPGHEPPAPDLARGDAAFLRMVQERGGPVLGRASTWAELEEGLAAVGLHLRIKGGGLSIHDGRQEVKASDVARPFSRRNMEERLGKLSDYRRTRPAVPAAPPAREPEPPAPEPVQPEQVRAAATQPGPRLDRTGSPTPGPEPEPGQTAEPEPTVARVQPPEPPQPVPTAPALPTLEPPARRRAPPPAQEAAPSPPPSGDEEFTWVLAREADRLQLRHEAELLQHGAGLIREARAAKDRAKVRSERERASHDAADRLAHLEARERRAVEAVEVLREKLRPVFADIAAAAGAMDRFEREHGMDKLRGMLDDRPETFGALVRQDWPFKLGWSTNKAAKLAKDVADDVENAIRCHRARPRKAELAAARERVEAAGAALVQTVEAARDLPGPTTLAHRAAEAFRPLIRDGRSVAWLSHQLARLLPPEDHEAAAIAENVLRAIERSIRTHDRSIRRGGLEI